ncbi:MAG: hypothetical protein J1G06_08975 [Oscillospiraceae bacterium]|nr:hypothetical protein [Oscillospiraceae bacterium]
MKTKRILSSVIAASMFAVCVPVIADYTAPLNDYDVEIVNEAFESGTVTNTIDNSNAFDVPEMTYSTAATPKEQYTDVITFDNTVLRRDYFLSFDFNFKTVNGEVPGDIRIDSKQRQGETNKLGPCFSYSDGQLRNQTGSNSYDKLGAIEPDTWYTAELEGKMVEADAITVFRLYKYENGVKTLVNTVDNLYLRQFRADQAGANGSPNRIGAADVYIDNVVLIQKYPNELTITAPDTVVNAAVNAGQNVPFDYVMSRDGVETTKYDIDSWTVFDQSGNEIDDGSISVTSQGVLTSKTDIQTQTVTVRAAATIGEKPLTGEFEITLNAVSTGDESLDTIEISGPSEVKAGESIPYTFTALKGGAEVVDPGAVKWSIYDPSDMYENHNKGISIENGVLTVADDVIAQDIVIRAASVPNGYVYASYPVKINFGDSQLETVVKYDACETTSDTKTRVESWDGSYAYQTGTTSERQGAFGNTGDYLVTEVDIKFIGEGSGFTLLRADGTQNSGFRWHNGNISIQTGGSSYDDYVTDADIDAWYHFEVVYSSTQENASFTVYKYTGQGMEKISTHLDINRRNRAQYGNIQIEKDTCFDNLKIARPLATSFDLSAPDTMDAGASAQVAISNIYRNDLPLLNYTVGFDWSLLDSTGQPIIENEDGTIDAEISTTGLLTTRAMGPVQTVTVRVKSGNAIKTLDINIRKGTIFEITNIGVDKNDNSKIVQLSINKKYEYNDDVTFILAFYDESGALIDVHIQSAFGSNYQVGEGNVPVEWNVPEAFNPETDTVKAFVWTRF